MEIEFLLVSNIGRYDVGLWVNQEGLSANTDPGANCFRDALVPVAVPATSCNHLGELYYDGDGDACGDLYANGTDPCGNAIHADCSSGAIDPSGVCVLTRRVVEIEILCADSDEDETVDTGACTSWDTSSLTECTGVLDASPATGSKCDCRVVTIAGLLADPDWVFGDGFESGDTSAWSDQASG